MKVGSVWVNAPIPSSHSLANRALRLLWNTVSLLLFRPSPRFLYAWRRFLLRVFGATVGKGAVVHSSAKIWAPWNLILGDFSAIGPDVDLYSVDKISVGSYSVVSQRSFICTATHDYRYVDLPLTTSPVKIGDYAWICAEVFVTPGVNVGDRAVLLARSFVTSAIDNDVVAGGHPAYKIRMRKILN